MDTTIFKTLGEIMKIAATAAEKPTRTQIPNDTTYACIGGNILIDGNMLKDIERANNATGIIDPNILRKTGIELSKFEQKYNMKSGNYILSGFSSINHFKVNSVEYSSSEGKYIITDRVVGIVNNGVLEIQAILTSRINL